MTEAPSAGDVAPGQGSHLTAEQHALEHHHDQHSGQQGDGVILGHVQQHGEPNPEEHQHPGPTTSVPPPSPTTASPVPAAFPKKRRGRPPGRPNATVRDADYEQNALVQVWNAAKNDRAVPVVSINIRDALTEQSLVHETQRTIFRLPSRETILFVQGWITAKHIASQRPSYVNGLLIHSRGQDAAVSCVQCAEKRTKNALGPFLSCRVLPGNYHNSCSNCKWFDNTSTCSLYTGPKPNRKRKAKEQLPPPPADGVGPPSNADGLNGGSEITSPAVDGQDDALIEPQLLSGPQPNHQPSPQSHAHPHLQPEADMAPTQPEGQHEQTPTTDSIDNDPSIHSQPHTELSGSDLPEAPSQPDSLTDSHFVLPKSDQEEAHLADDGDTDWQLSCCLSFSGRIPRELNHDAGRAWGIITPTDMFNTTVLLGPEQWLLLSVICVTFNHRA
ncbi:hypothetical protein C8A01DRAFT_15648 [Parachaetomium inaequale]|uniref:Uncharacterized protein n=1 Tax=Parachaetomium inaequale TaxID=2588326 RepID=A0AAN6SSK4_9PEZI|nr:hypothetical protein C8A01DRAFT_15648 [Parachaetomium inaequale]